MKLGLLYRKYLRGSDLSTPVTVEIQALKLVQVQPHPTSPKMDKWCLLVSGLPEDLPSGILFGPKGEARLSQIFGNVDVDSLKGKKLELFPSPCNIGGVRKNAIGFRAPSNGKPPVVAKPAVPSKLAPPASSVDEIPF